MSDAEDPEQALGFEEALGKLEEITRQVESGALPLEKALDEFERGVRLAARCREELTRAETRIQVLVDEGKLEPFEFSEPG